MIPIDTQLGRLRIDRVLDEYDGPRLFVAKNSSGACFLALWVETVVEGELWIYAPISENRLRGLVSGAIPIRDIYTSASDGWIFRIILGDSGRIVKFSPVRLSELDLDELPPEGDVLHIRNPEAETRLGRFLRLYLKPGAGSKQGGVRLPSVTSIWQKWGVCQEATAYALGSTYQWDPSVASVAMGSLSVDVQISRNTLHTDVVDTWARFFRAARKPNANIGEEVSEHSIDTSACLSFLNAVRIHNVDVEISVVEGDGVLVTFGLDPQLATAIYTQIEKMVPALASSRIPQADDLRKIVALTQATRTSMARPDPEDLALGSVRQVNYYRHAARILGLMDANDMLTMAGRALSGSSLNEQRSLLRTQFEVSECGAAWMRWAEEASLGRVDPTTANEFLSDTTYSVSEETVRRRSKTIERWHHFLFDPQVELLLDSIE